MPVIKKYTVILQNSYDPNSIKYIILYIYAYNAKDVKQQAKLVCRNYERQPVSINKNLKTKYSYVFKVHRIYPHFELPYPNGYRINEELFKQIEGLSVCQKP